jgi:hypothetical protein
VLGALREADATVDHHLGGVGRRCAVVDDGDALDARDEVGTVERAVEAEGLAQFGGAAAQVALPAGRSSTATPSPASPHTALAHQCMP